MLLCGLLGGCLAFLLMQKLFHHFAFATLVVVEVLVRGDVARETSHWLHVARNNLVEIFKLLHTQQGQNSLH